MVVLHMACTRLVALRLWLFAVYDGDQHVYPELATDVCG